MPSRTPITSPDDPALDELCRELAGHTAELDVTGHWPAEQLRLCGEYGVHRWFVPVQFGGLGWNEADVVRGYLRLSAACLTTTFILTQRTGAVLRIANGSSSAAQERWLPGLLSGELFATVAISQLTTSRRHLAQPAMRAELRDDEVLLDGFSAWVTGGCEADAIVVGAVTADGQQALVVVPRETSGVGTPEPPKLVGLSASMTGELCCDGVRVPLDHLLAGPMENVLKHSGTGTGGLQTSTLAVGLASAAIDYLEEESLKRTDLAPPADNLRTEHSQLKIDLLALADGQQICSNEQLRTRANSLVLRATQAALAAAKGTGYVLGHPAGRWCRESLFFLVWSCPQPVLQANLCELAGLSD